MRTAKHDLDWFIDDQTEPPGSPTGDNDTGYMEVPDIDFDRPSAAEVRRHRRQWRATLNDAALLTAEEVVEALPGRATTIRRWLDRVPRYRLPTGQEVYRWGDILQTLERVA